MSGHSLKHLVSAGAVFVVIRMLMAPRRRHIREANADEAKALAEEGIEFHPLPVLPEEQN